MIRDELQERTAVALARTAELVERFDLPARITTSPDTLATQLSEAALATREMIRTAGETPNRTPVVPICEHILDLVSLLDETRQRAADHRLAALCRVQKGLGRLRGLNRVADVLERGPEELVRTVGFDRAVIFRVDGSNMVAHAHCFAEQPEWAKEVLTFAQLNAPRLDHTLLETDMIRRGAALLVADPRHDPRAHRALTDAYRTRSYVAAPIMPQGRVIGFLHADYYFSSREVSPLDRQALWTFAEGFGYALERTTLHERMQAQRIEMRRLIGSAESAMDGFCDANVELPPSRAESWAEAAIVTPIRSPGRSEMLLDHLLTRREIEVLEMMADGATNAWIADRFVISEGTVKSHVKHILRKLHSANRAEAVARYMRQVSAAGRLRRP